MDKRVLTAIGAGVAAALILRSRTVIPPPPPPDYQIPPDAVPLTWQALAEKWANAYGAWLPIVLATVDAETGGENMTGDGGDSLGFGQVQPRWHMWAFIRAAIDVGVAAATDLLGLTRQMMSSRDFSMAVAVLVIKSYWDSASGGSDEERWVNFTKHYVGSGIPADDLERRRRIWHKYRS